MRSYDSEHIKSVTQPYRKPLENVNEKNGSVVSNKHRFLEVETMSQNIHPNNSLQHYSSIMNSTMQQNSIPKISVTSKSKKPMIPKFTSSKTSSIKFCSSKKKKSNSRGRRKAKQIQSTKISTRLLGNKLIQSIDCLPLSSKAKPDLKQKPNKENSYLSIYTNELLSKYEGENLGNQTVLTSNDRMLLTQKALSSTREEPFRNRPIQVYSASPDSLNESSSLSRKLAPVQRRDNLISNTTEPQYINLVNEENRMGLSMDALNPVTRVRVNEVLHGARRSKDLSSSSKSRSKSSKKKKSKKTLFSKVR